MIEKLSGKPGGTRELIALLLVGLGLLAAAALISVPASTQGTGTQISTSVAGLWLDNEGKARVEIAPCGGEMCGRIVWLKEPLDPKGKPWTDILNPEAAKKVRPICGLQIIGGLKPATNGTWTGGWVYDPEEGKQFNLELSLKDANTLTVLGYVGLRLLSETFYWQRQPGNLPRCTA